MKILLANLGGCCTICTQPKGFTGIIAMVHVSGQALISNPALPIVPQTSVVCLISHENFLDCQMPL